MQSLIDDVRDWYRRLPNLYISSWHDFQRVFREKYGDHNDARLRLGEIITIQKNQNEMVIEFNARFIKVVSRIPRDMDPNDALSLAFYLKAFDLKFGYDLGSREPETLRDAFKAAIRIENNRRATGKIGKREEVKILQNPKNN